jgi:hypothetical protein
LKGRASERKPRLFACACCRAVWPCLTDERGRRAVEAAERFADGGATAQEMLAAAHGAGTAEYDATADSGGEDEGAQGRSHAMAAAYWAAASPETAARAASWGGCPAALAADSAASAAAWGLLDAESDREWVRVRAAQARLARCVFGSPRRPVSPDASRLGGAARRLAQAAYDERAFGHLPVLADALEDAGCTDGDLLGHLRGPGPHARGCWALDLVLGKE